MSFIIGFNKDSGCVTEISKSYQEKMVFPQSYESVVIKSIGSYAHNGGLCTFIDLSATSITSIGNWAFYNSRVKTIVFPNTLVSIGSNAFISSDVEIINIPASTTSIDMYAWNHAAHILYYNVDPNNPTYSSVNGFLMDKYKIRVISSPRNITTEKDFPYCERIEGWSLTLARLKTFVGNKDLKALGFGAFHALNELDLLDLSRTSITVIPAYFIQSSRVKELILPSHLETIAKKAFDTIPLRSIVIPASVTSIEDGAFTAIAHFSVYYLGNQNFSTSNMFGDIPKENIKVYVTHFYLQSQFGNIDVEFISKKPISCQRKLHNYKTSLFFTVLYLS